MFLIFAKIPKYNGMHANNVTIILAKKAAIVAVSADFAAKNFCAKSCSINENYCGPNIYFKCSKVSILKQVG